MTSEILRGDVAGSVELWRASIQDFRAGHNELDRERTLTKMAELWDPEIEEASFGKYAQVATFRNGLMVHWKHYLRQPDALEAAGVSG